jgi:lipoprotein-anchoring transpeptidase ErfK/SrfK
VPLRRLIFVLVFAVSSAATPGWTQTPPPPPGPATIAEGVTIGQIPVGGMTEAEARKAVLAVFDRKLPFKFRKRTWAVSPYSLGSSPYLNMAIEAALAAEPGAAVKLHVKVHTGKVRRYVDYLGRVFNRKARNSQLTLRNLRPYLSKPRVGFLVRKTRMYNAISRALALTERRTLPLQVLVLRPRITRASYGPIIVIRRGSRRLYLYRNVNFVRRFPIAVGTRAYPTPLGRYRVVMKEKHPTWNPPNSPWAAGLGPVPPGPGNPLGTRWIGTSAPGIGIHGTPQPWTVGTAASHGCIRMYMRQVEWLYERVRIGTPVFIVRQ